MSTLRERTRSFETSEGLGYLPDLAKRAPAAQLTPFLENAEDYARTYLACLPEGEFTSYRESIERSIANVPKGRPLERRDVWEVLAVRRAETIRSGPDAPTLWPALDSPGGEDELDVSDSSLGIGFGTLMSSTFPD